ncbi:MAG TPA: nucleotidyltransferase family protein [Sphingobacteriaceae bacterium]
MESQQNGYSCQTGILVLAAGRSSRLGRPKQLLVVGDLSLLKHSLRAAESSVAAHIRVVLGAYSAAVGSETVGGRTRAVINPHWEEGISSSIRCGLAALTEDDPSITGVVLMVCDQPGVTAGLLDQLIAMHWETGRKIVASAFAGTVGTPVFFHRSLFPELLELTGDAGGKTVILSHLADMASVDFPDGANDIDTEADYLKIIKKG